MLIYVDEHGGLLMKNDEAIHDLLQKANVLCSSEFFLLERFSNRYVINSLQLMEQ